MLEFRKFDAFLLEQFAKQLHYDGGRFRIPTLERV